MKDPLITSRRGLLLMIVCILCGFVGFLLSLAAEAARSDVTWLMVTGGSGNGTHQCFYTRSGKTSFTYAIAAFFMLTIAMLAEHAFILRSLSSDRPPALSSWTTVDFSRSSVISTLTWKACALFVTTWIAFAVAEVLLVIGIGIESGNLSDWKALRYKCVVVKEGLFVAAGIFGLVTVFLAAGLYMTALRAQRFHQNEQQNPNSHQRSREGGGRDSSSSIAQTETSTASV